MHKHGKNADRKRTRVLFANVKHAEIPEVENKNAQTTSTYKY